MTSLVEWQQRNTTTIEESRVAMVVSRRWCTEMELWSTVALELQQLITVCKLLATYVPSDTSENEVIKKSQQDDGDQGHHQQVTKLRRIPITITLLYKKSRELSRQI